MTLNYARNDYDDAYNEVQNLYYINVSSIHEPGISRRDIKEHYNFYMFDLRYRKTYISSAVTATVQIQCSSWRSACC